MGRYSRTLPLATCTAAYRVTMFLFSAGSTVEHARACSCGQNRPHRSNARGRARGGSNRWWAV